MCKIRPGGREEELEEGALRASPRNKERITAIVGVAWKEWIRAIQNVSGRLGGIYAPPKSLLKLVERCPRLVECVSPSPSETFRLWWEGGT